MYDELDKAAQAGDDRACRRHLQDLQRALPAHRLHAAGRPARGQGAGRQGPGRGGAAPRSTWVAENAGETEYRTHRPPAAGRPAARRRRSTTRRSSSSTAASGKEFEALVADRRGDVLLAQGKTDEAKAAYQQAWKAMDEKVDYRRLVEAKLTALGAAPAAEAPKTARPGRRNDAARLRRGWSCALALLAACSQHAGQAQAHAAGAHRRADRRAGRSGASASTRELPARRGGERRRVHAWPMATARCSRCRPTPAASCGAPAWAASSAPASAAMAASPPW